MALFDTYLEAQKDRAARYYCPPKSSDDMLLDYNGEERIAHWWHNHGDGTYTTYSVQDCTPAIEKLKALQNAGIGGAGRLNDYARAGIKAGWWHAAHIPMMVILEWKKKYGVNLFHASDWPKVRKLINSAEYSGLKTSRANV